MIFLYERSTNKLLRFKNYGELYNYLAEKIIDYVLNYDSITCRRLSTLELHELLLKIESNFNIKINRVRVRGVLIHGLSSSEEFNEIIVFGEYL